MSMKLIHIEERFERLLARARRRRRRATRKAKLVRRKAVRA